MKIYGWSYLLANYPNYTFGKKYKNWWENNNKISKKYERQKAKKEIEKQLNDR